MGRRCSPSWKRARRPADNEPMDALASDSVMSKFHALADVRRQGDQVSLASLAQVGDVARYWSGNIAQFMPTALLPRRVPAMPLREMPDERIGRLNASTALGELALDDYLGHPEGRTQGFIVVHKGCVAYEAYPGMRAEDPHLWASNAKPMAGLLIELLIDDGCIDEQTPMGHYVAEFRDTAWADISVRDVLDMTPGLDTEENDTTRADPGSLAMRAFRAEFGETDPATGEVQKLLDVLRSARRVRAPGLQFEYGSPVTQALVLLAEAVTGRSWAELFDERVWSAMGADGELQIHLSPDRIALVHGLVSSRLRDMARFGLLYTPSWHCTATRCVVSPGMLARIRTGLRSHTFFMRGYDGAVFTERVDAPIVCNSRQWDAVFGDGDLLKTGFMGQCLYVSPLRDLVICGVSTNPDNGASLLRYLRPLATSGLFD